MPDQYTRLFIENNQFELNSTPLDKMAAIVADDNFNCIFWGKKR